MPEPPAGVAATLAFAEPEDRGTATLSALGEVEYVEDLNPRHDAARCGAGRARGGHVAGTTTAVL
ncbi:MAG TPA: hypothetical protein VLM76_04790 [Patescibacteria group bacterium]|nr:hypothetical protein [Patescibacteria group bacterium]